MFGSCHMDKQPMSLIHTTDTMLDGAPRFRAIAVYNKGKVVRKQYTLHQPAVHATYRNNFWLVDRFNRVALGPESMQYAVRATDWTKRMFFALVGISETSAYFAHSQIRELGGHEQYSRYEWKRELASTLCNDPFQVRLAARMQVPRDKDLWTILRTHVGAMPRKDKKVKVCRVCSEAGKYGEGSTGTHRSMYMCGCGAHLCRGNETSVC